jgi:hypothetical protein
MKDKNLKEAISNLKDAYSEVSTREAELDAVSMPIRNMLFDGRDRKGLIALCRDLPDCSMAWRYTLQLIYELENLAVKGEEIQ